MAVRCAAGDPMSLVFCVELLWQAELLCKSDMPFLSPNNRRRQSSEGSEVENTLHLQSQTHLRSPSDTDRFLGRGVGSGGRGGRAFAPFMSLPSPMPMVLAVLSAYLESRRTVCSRPFTDLKAACTSNRAFAATTYYTRFKVVSVCITQHRWKRVIFHDP